MNLNHKSVTPARLLIMLSFLAIASLVLALCSGSGQAGFFDLLRLPGGCVDLTTQDVLLKLRLPRALAAFGTGAALALAGVMM